MPASRSRCLVSCETSSVFDTMREDLTCNVLPIVKDAMDGMAYNAGGVASLPSNGYYGYQPHLAHKVKTENTQETMDYECYAAQSVLRLNRKRAWEFGDGAEFKKRRQNGKDVCNLTMVISLLFFYLLSGYSGEFRECFTVVDDWRSSNERSSSNKLLHRLF